LKRRSDSGVVACALIVGISMISGCSGGPFSPKNDTYELTGIPPVSGPSSRGRQIVVTDPTALKSLDSTNIVVRTSPSSIQYLARSQWNDNLPDVIQQSLIEAFVDSKRLGGVGQPGDSIAVDYLVSPTIRAFEVVTGTGGDTAVVEIAVRIVNDRNGVVRATKTFQATAPVRGNTNADFIHALDEANGTVIHDIVAWTLKIV